MSKNKTLTIYIFLTLATLAAFWQVNYCDFINYDDPKYVTKNIHIQDGVTMDGIWWAFTTGYAANWHPLTWLSHMLDFQLFGLTSGRHHLTNLLFHIANALLLFFVLHRMTKALWQSAFAAALFALHPLHVESVAWVAERKDVLSTFFWIVTMGAYCYYVERPSPQRYLYVLVFFTLGLMAKPMLVTLPIVLLLLDYWPLGRFERNTADQTVQEKSGNRALPDKQRVRLRRRDAIKLKEKVHTDKSADIRYQLVLIRPLLWEKIPLFALSVISCIITYIAQQKGGAVRSFEAFPLSDRVSNAIVSYVVYIRDMFWPRNLAVFYPYYHEWKLWQILAALIILSAITFMVIRAARKLRYLPIGWFWYVGTLIPVIGLVQVGAQARADRYTYIPMVGLFIMLAWGIPELLEKWSYRERVFIGLSTLTLSCLFMLTWTQVGYWKNDFTLYNHALQVTEKNHVVSYNRGNAYAAVGDHKQAIADYDKAIEINPGIAIVYYNRGNAYAALGNKKQAIADYDKTIELDLDFAKAYYSRGNASMALRNQKQAIADYDNAIKINPNDAEAYINRGNSYMTLGNPKQAIADFDKAIEINPGIAKAYYNRGNAYVALGNQKQAIMDYDRAIKINPNDAEAYINRGNSNTALGDPKLAIADYDKAIGINPEIATAYYNRGNAYAALGNRKQSIVDYDKAIEINPEYAEAYVDRGNACAAVGSYYKSILDYNRAIEINPEYALAYYNRAASYNKLGNRRQAYEDMKKAAMLGDRDARNIMKSQE
ncbi:MAG TPA: tetratricopeptide repeat protein [Syntrophales bacterium]|nr:tetratricopeptide repeat protein [Syntrophales bacterium]